MFLSPSGTLGMKYWVRWARLERAVWLDGSLTPAEILMENVGIAAGRPKCGMRSARGSRVCTSPAASPSEETGVRAMVMGKSGSCIPSSPGTHPQPRARRWQSSRRLPAHQQLHRAGGTRGPRALAAPLGFFTFLRV